MFFFPLKREERERERERERKRKKEKEEEREREEREERQEEATNATLKNDGHAVRILWRKKKEKARTATKRL